MNFVIIVVTTVYLSSSLLGEGEILTNTAFGNFANNAKRLRDEKGFSQSELAEAMGLKGQFTVSDIENLRGRISIEQLVAYSNFFGVSATSLLIDSCQDQLGLMYPSGVNYRQQVGQNLERLIKEKGLSFEQFIREVSSYELRFSEKEYWKAKSGELFLSIDFLLAFSAVLGVSIEKLLWSPERKTVYSNEVAGPNIRLLRKELDLSLAELAKLVASLGVGVSKSYIGYFETGKRALSVTQLMAFTVELGTTVKTLLTPPLQQQGELVTPYPPMWEALQTTESKSTGRTSTEVYYDRRLGQNLRYLREQQGMSQWQLAEELRDFVPSASQSMICFIETGEYSGGARRGFKGVSVDFLMAIATIFAKGKSASSVEFAEILLTQKLWGNKSMNSG
jgi:transcriptional regulator with XRE-family HTH domain